MVGPVPVRLALVPGRKDVGVTPVLQEDWPHVLVRVRRGWTVEDDGSEEADAFPILDPALGGPSLQGPMPHLPHFPEHSPPVLPCMVSRVPQSGTVKLNSGHGKSPSSSEYPLRESRRAPRHGKSAAPGASTDTAAVCRSRLRRENPDPPAQWPPIPT